MQTSEQVAGEAREKLAERLLNKIIEVGKERGWDECSFINEDKDARYSYQRQECLDELIAALRAQPERGAEEWNYDMSAAPVGPDNSVLVTVPSLHADWPPFVGEAWYCTEEAGEGWWWSGTSPRDYHASPIRETNAEPIAWRHRPEPAPIRALPLHPAKDSEDRHE